MGARTGASASDKGRKLNVRHLKFIEGILQGLSAAEAYLRAGYKCTRESAYRSASQLLRKPEVWDEIERRLQEAQRIAQARLVKLLDRAVRVYLEILSLPENLDRSRALAMRLKLNAAHDVLERFIPLKSQQELTVRGISLEELHELADAYERELHKRKQTKQEEER